MKFVDLQAQYQAYKEAIDASIAKVFEHGQFILGPEVAQLEEELADFVGVKSCITTSSGTDSLEIALRGLGIGPGDEVITVPFTWISTAEAIELVGAKVVFIDIEADTYNMDMAKLRAAITERTKAIIPVSLFGQIPDLDQANKIAEEFGIAIIEDGAQSFGATSKGRRSCSFTTIGSTSFFPAKPFGCYGDGGALFTDDEELSLRMKRIRNHGSDQRHHHPHIGMNGRFDTIQAATLLAKLPHFDGEIQRRSEIGEIYSEQLHEVCKTPHINEGNSHVYGQYTIRVNDREEFQKTLSAKEIPTAIYYPRCLHEQPVYENLGYGLGDFPVAEKAAKEVLSLPMHPFQKNDEQERVIKAVLESQDSRKGETFVSSSVDGGSE
jgi:UDP-2-acetamido-2-deoxy-ribo-hexuluronate aminotransferase